MIQNKEVTFYYFAFTRSILQFELDPQIHRLTTVAQLELPLLISKQMQPDLKYSEEPPCSYNWWVGHSDSRFSHKQRSCSMYLMDSYLFLYF